MKSINESLIGSRNEDLNIQDINTVCLEFNIDDVINTLILKNAFYISLIMYNIMAIELLKVKDFSVIIWKNDLALYGPNETKLTIFDVKHWFIMC